jgi:ABC-type Fe3+ transport system substrate-binding protein
MIALAKQVVLTSNNQEPPDALARGQYAMAIAPNIPRTLALIEQGAPLKFVHPKEGSHLSESGIVFIRNAPHPNSAKLFLQWLFTREGQALFARALPAISVRKDVPQDYLPDGLRYVDGAPFLAKDVTDMRQPEKAAELRNLAKEIFAK